jgi:hypothetical protein
MPQPTTPKGSADRVAYLEGKEVCDAYTASSDEANKWREDYPEFERLMNNGLLEDLEDLPDVNDGSLAASLFKFAKRVIRKKMAGRVTAIDSDDAWLSELANIEWTDHILKNAKSKASPRRKWKDAARKAAGYGGQPIISLFVENGGYAGADFIVPYAPDVKLEAGKDSDVDSDIIFWDCYFTKLQLKNMLEDAVEEMKEIKGEQASWVERKQQYEAEHAGDPDAKPFEEQEPMPYNEWDVDQLQDIVDSDEESDRPGNEESTQRMASGTKTSGYHFYVAFQRGVGAPFAMYFNKKDHDNPVRKWSNPDPTGDLPVHYLYCYQDFINPYGTGIVQLAGGTQNVLDYLRKVDVMATQLGLRRPKIISGDTDRTDFDSMVFEEDATWEVGDATVDFVDIANDVYRELPGRIEQYQTSLQKYLPMGDSSISSANSGDPQVGRTPQALKMAAASLSIDDEDFSENVDECYAAVAESMINIHFANMQGSDLRKLTADQVKILQQAGIDFPLDEIGQPTRELNVEWDKARAKFRFEVDADADKSTDDATKLEGYKATTDFLSNPNTQVLLKQAQSGQPLILGSKKVDLGELIGSMIALTTDNDKIVTDVTPEELEQRQTDLANQAQADAAAQAAEQDRLAQQDAAAEPPLLDGGLGEQEPPAAEPQPLPAQAAVADISPEEAAEDINDVMEYYGVDQDTAAQALEAEHAGMDPQQVIARFLQPQPEPEMLS